MDAPGNRDDVFVALDRLIAATGDFVAAWGEADPQMVDLLEDFTGWSLPPDFRAFALRYANANIGYTQVLALGPLDGLPAAQALTEERRSEWTTSFPPDCLALGEVNTDLIVLRSDGVVEFRTESSQDLAVFESHPSFTSFLKDAIDWATDRAKWLECLPQSFDPWQTSS